MSESGDQEGPKKVTKKMNLKTDPEVANLFKKESRDIRFITSSDIEEINEAVIKREESSCSPDKRMPRGGKNGNSNKFKGIVLEKGSNFIAKSIPASIIEEVINEEGLEDAQKSPPSSPENRALNEKAAKSTAKKKARQSAKHLENPPNRTSRRKNSEADSSPKPRH